jgi:serine/threonine protein kinase
MSTEKQIRLPSTEEVNALGGVQQGVEHLAGTVLLDRYRLAKLLGTGGAAVVYRAEHTIMHKAVAVKILRPELAQRQDFVRRFLAEARTVARLRHENIVDIVDVGRTETGLVFCVMEYLEGEELGVTLGREGRLSWARARDIVMQVCRALAAAHAAGVVHRDVKPQNCFRIRHGKNEDFIKLLDFGISKQLDNDQGLTATGMIMGTAEYMSPEQARGRNVDARTDIYAVGAMLFELLAGRPPFEGETFLDVLMKHATDPVPRISSYVDGLDANVDALLSCALAKKPEDRFQTPQQFIVALNAIADDTFVGLLDTRSLKQLNARPDSVLPRASGPHASLNRHVRPWQVALGATIPIVLAGVGFSFWVRTSSDEDVAVTTANAPAEAPTRAPREAVTPPTLGKTGPIGTSAPAPAPPVVEPTRDVSPPTDSVTPTPPPAASESPTAATSEPRSVETVPRAKIEKTPTSAVPRAAGASKPSESSKKTKRLLQNRISSKCNDESLDAVQPVVVEISESGFEFPELRYMPLKKCIRDKVVREGLAKGRYAMTFVVSTNTPRTIEPFGDE